MTIIINVLQNLQIITGNYQTYNYKMLVQRLKHYYISARVRIQVRYLENALIERDSYKPQMGLVSSFKRVKGTRIPKNKKKKQRPLLWEREIQQAIRSNKAHTTNNRKSPLKQNYQAQGIPQNAKALSLYINQVKRRALFLLAANQEISRVSVIRSHPEWYSLFMPLLYSSWIIFIIMHELKFYEITALYFVYVMFLFINLSIIVSSACIYLECICHQNLRPNPK